MEAQPDAAGAALFDDETGAPLNEAATRLVERAGGGTAGAGAGAGAAAGGRLAALAPVSIAPGKWKYVAIELTDSLSGATKRIVRSYEGLSFHAHAFEHAMKEPGAAGSKGRVIGGGRIVYDPSARTVSVYGYSKTFGRAKGCNEHSAGLIEAAMPDCTVSWSDKGY